MNPFAPPPAWPLQPPPAVVRAFEQPAKPWLPGHRGVDLAGYPGQPVLAAVTGKITYAGPLAGRGVVTITTGARRTTYEPVVPSVRVGAAVSPATVIGHLSAAGSHCRPATCLHWGLLAGDHYLNPLTLVPDRPVRLLPLTTTPPLPTSSAAPRATSSAAPPAAALPGAAQPAGSTAAEQAPPPAPDNERTAHIIIAATAALTVGAGALIRRE
jgi:murein DD-endopeptidase MepM/ murein hydrolase activator NlpD